MKPSGTTISADEYALPAGPVSARIFFERRPVTGEFIADVVSPPPRWLGGRTRTIVCADVPLADE